MSKFCPITGEKVVYLVCQECEDRVCEQDDVTNGASCNKCMHKVDEHEILLFGEQEAIVDCKVFPNQIVQNKSVERYGCKYHNVDMSNEKICMNCKQFLGGGDWGLACKTHYHRLPTALTKACKQFDKKE